MNDFFFVYIKIATKILYISASETRNSDFEIVDFGSRIILALQALVSTCSFWGEP